MGSLSQPESQVSSSLSLSKEKSLSVDAIKKKMQAMKAEKDNACDRSDATEEAMKAARLRADKAEEEVNDLVIKTRQLETELDMTNERYTLVSMQLEEKEKALLAAEAEMNALNRRVQTLEEDLEKTEEKLLAANTKLDKAATAADDSERAKKVFEKKAEERADVGETKILELEEELRVVANNLKSLEVAEEKANQREKTYKEQIKTLSAKLKQAEARAEFAEKSVQKLQKEVDRLEDELVSEQEKYKAITEELEQTFAEMSGY